MITKRAFWSGNKVSHLGDKDIFVFGSNPQGRHGAGAARDAMAFGAVRFNGRGLQGRSYALVTKNLKAGFKEKKTGIVYEKEGYLSVSDEQIIENIKELYICAESMPDHRFLIPYKVERWPNGGIKKSLNGHGAIKMLDLFFAAGTIPINITFHNSLKPFWR